MPRIGLNAKMIVMAAAEITDEKGFDAVTLKALSKKFGISTPSLYSHIDGLPDLKEKVSAYAMEMLRDSLVRASMGHSGIEAIKALGLAYIRFAQEHTGLYETTQWMNIASDVQAGSFFSDVVELVYKIGAEVGMGELEASHIIRTVRSLAHGFASIESHNGFSHPSSVESSYEYAVDMLYLGIKAAHEQRGKGNA